MALLTAKECEVGWNRGPIKQLCAANQLWRIWLQRSIKLPDAVSFILWDTIEMHQLMVYIWLLMEKGRKIWKLISRFELKSKHLFNLLTSLGGRVRAGNWGAEERGLALSTVHPAAPHTTGEVKDLGEFTQSLKSLGSLALISCLLRSWGPSALEFIPSVALYPALREKVFHCPSSTSQVGPRREFYSYYLRHISPTSLAGQKEPWPGNHAFCEWQMGQVPGLG